MIFVISLAFLLFHVCNATSHVSPTPDHFKKVHELLKSFFERNAETEIEEWNEPDHKTIATRLRHDIRQQYGISSFNFKPVPRASHKETLNVSLAFQLREIAAVNERSQSVTLRGLLTLTWHDQYLKWEPNKYKHLTMLELADHELWVPPVRATDDTDMARMYRDGHVHSGRTVLVTSEGYCMVMKPVGIKIRCPAMDFKQFPRDSHTCRLGFTLDHIPDRKAPSVRLGFGGDFAYLKRESMDDEQEFEFYDHFLIPQYHHNLSLEWILTDFWRDETHFTDWLDEKDSQGDDKHMFSLLFYNFRFKRRITYYGFVYTLPVLMATAFLILTFMIPLGDRQRYWMAMAGFVSLILVYNRIFQQMPTSQSAPDIVRFYGLSLVMCLLTLFETVLLSRALRHHQLIYALPPPNWMQSVFSKLSRLVCYRNRDRVTIERDNEQFDIQNEFALEMESSEQSNPALNPQWQDMIKITDSLIFVFFALIYLIGIMKFVL